MKKCGKCEEVKSLDQFHKSSAGKYGVASACKQCRSIAAAVSRVKNLDRDKEKLLQRTRQW